MYERDNGREKKSNEIKKKISEIFILQQEAKKKMSRKKLNLQSELRFVKLLWNIHIGRGKKDKSGIICGNEYNDKMKQNGS